MPVQAQGFGSVLAVGEGEVLAGAGGMYRPGTVYVYRKVGGAWREADQLNSSSAKIADRFGVALALSDSTLFVGVGGTEGSVEVFTKTGGRWSSAGTRIVAPDSVASDGFGRVIAGSDDWLFVGVPNRDQGEKGAVYGFRMASNGAWKQQAVLAPTDSAAVGSGFGSSIAVEGDVLLIGAPRATVPAPAPKPNQRVQPTAPPERTGLVYVYELSSGKWRETGTISARGLQPDELFGFAVALRDGTAFLGTPGILGGFGATFVFHQNADGRWKELSRLAAFSAHRGERFGIALAVDGSDILVGSQTSRLGGGPHIFQSDRADSVFTAVRTLAPAQVQPTEQFGGGLAIRGGVAVVGARGIDHGAGGIYIFETDGAQWSTHGPFVPPMDEMPALAGKERTCEDGKVQVFDCHQVELLAYMPPSKVTNDGGRGVRFNDIWGWTDPETGREYAILGRSTGTSFIDVTTPVNPRLIGDLPGTEGASPSTWRDIKVYKDHAFIVSEARGHGMQVFDLTRLRNAPVGGGTTFDEDAHYDRIASAHNVVVDTASGFAFAVGAGGDGETCGGGLHMIDVRNPRTPQFAGCFADQQTGRASTGYTHDAQCVTYHGPDEEYQGREICLGANETALSIADVTDKAAPVALARATYPNVGYAHQGWLTDDHRYFYMNDELDEGQSQRRGEEPRTRTIIWDLRELEDPLVLAEFFSTEGATDHNLYVKGNLVFQSHYKAGLRVLDITDPANPVEVGYFDTDPYRESVPGFTGAWSNYPFFKSGTIVVSGMGEGMFVLKLRDRKAVM